MAEQQVNEYAVALQYLEGEVGASAGKVARAVAQLTSEKARVKALQADNALLRVRISDLERVDPVAEPPEQAPPPDTERSGEADQPSELDPSGG